MTDQTTNELTILFSDICRSTVLFDELGDEMALNVVMQAIDLASTIATENHGTIIGTIGDEVMCTFKSPEDAIITATQIHFQMKSNAVMQTHNLAMRVGINCGSVVSMSNNVYGDTVNIAARLAQQAKANQTLVSSNTIESIRENLRDQLRLIGRINLRGKAGTIEVHEVLETGAPEEITEVTTNTVVTGRAFLMTARYLSRQMRFDPMLVRFLFGRSVDCDQVVDHPTVSREHAEFLYKNGQFIFRDFSTNGSVVVRNGRNIKVHRSGVELQGSGKVFLGKTLGQHHYGIEYSCISSQ
jgi:class 3 adenylate cyclase